MKEGKDKAAAKRAAAKTADADADATGAGNSSGGAAPTTINDEPAAPDDSATAPAPCRSLRNKLN